MVSSFSIAASTRDITIQKRNYVKVKSIVYSYFWQIMNIFRQYGRSHICLTEPMKIADTKSVQWLIMLIILHVFFILDINQSFLLISHHTCYTNQILIKTCMPFYKNYDRQLRYKTRIKKKQVSSTRMMLIKLQWQLI